MIFQLLVMAHYDCLTPSPSKNTHNIHKRDGMVNDMLHQFYETPDYFKGIKTIYNKLQQQNTNLTFQVNWFYMGNVKEIQIRTILEKVNFKYNYNNIPIKFNLNHSQAIDGNKIGYYDDQLQQDLWDQYAIKNPNILNIFSSKLSDHKAGWSSLPGYSRDAIFLSAPDIFSDSEEYLAGYISHEIGHWLGLFHTFEGGCLSKENDYVKDTPRTDDRIRVNGMGGLMKVFGNNVLKSYDWKCNDKIKSCSKSFGNDLLDNFMDYTSCRIRITLGQQYRIMNFVYWRLIGELPFLE
eukprot:NODE_1056_length_2404_cov_0.775705.p1 type:complete len:294 gc:universal NODE_1056_length_2404_cov_0.775705:1012-1893(+)